MDVLAVSNRAHVLKCSFILFDTFPGESGGNRSQLAEALGVADKGFHSMEAGVVHKPTSAA